MRFPIALALSMSSLCAVLVCAPVSAQVTVHEPWVRGTVPEQKATGAFMRLTAQTDSHLVSASSPVAGIVEIHEMKMDNGVMRMRAVPGLPLPAGRAVDLAPGGYHVMLIGLKQPLKAGESVPISLVFEGADRQRRTVDVKATVRPLNAPAQTAQGHAGHDAKPATSNTHKH